VDKAVVLPILHGGKFTWDEALVLLVIMAAVPIATWFMGRRERRAKRSSQSPPEPAPKE
jgi:hypothetical protein